LSFAYVDASFLVGIALEQPNHEEMKAGLAEFDFHFSSNLLEAEMRSALLREQATADARPYLEPIEWVLPGRSLGPEIRRALGVARLKGGDLWHVACSLYLRASLAEELVFLTLDERQRAAVAELGFATA